MKIKPISGVLSVLIGGILLIFLTSCEKEAGPGGKSTLYGRVRVNDYNSSFTVLQETYYGPGIWVYLIYGSDRNYSDRVQTGPDGLYEFKYLRKGSYRLYALSKDSTLTTNALVPVLIDAEIASSGKKEIELPDIVIFD